MLLIPRLLLGSLWFCFACAIGIMAGIFRPFNPKNTKLTTDLIKFGRHFIGLHIELAHLEGLPHGRLERREAAWRRARRGCTLDHARKVVGRKLRERASVLPVHQK